MKNKIAELEEKSSSQVIWINQSNLWLTGIALIQCHEIRYYRVNYLANPILETKKKQNFSLNGRFDDATSIARVIFQ